MEGVGAGAGGGMAAAAREWPRPIATVDVVVLALIRGRLSVGLLRRNAAGEPEQGRLALPGGFVRVGEDANLDDAARRVLANKAGMAARYMEQLETRGDAERDPRGWSLSVSYAAIGEPGAAPGLAFHDAEALPALAFDHGEIVAAGLRRLRAKASYSALPLLLLPAPFTVSEARDAYERVGGERVDAANFRRKLLALGVLDEVGERREVGRPTRLYRVRDGSAVTFRRPILS